MFEHLHREYRQAITSHDLDSLACHLSVNASALDQLEIGWRAERPRGFTFPLRSPSGLMVGLQIRMTNGDKCCVRGSDLTKALAIPAISFDPDQPLFVTEGISDCAALLSLEIQAFARISTATSARLVQLAVHNYGCRSVVVVADVDHHGRGQIAAEQTAAVLRAYGVCAHVLYPPYKDVREWIACGAQRETVIQRSGL